MELRLWLLQWLLQQLHHQSPHHYCSVTLVSSGLQVPQKSQLHYGSGNGQEEVAGTCQSGKFAFCAHSEAAPKAFCA